MTDDTDDTSAAPTDFGWWIQYSGHADGRDTLTVGCTRELDRGDVLRLLSVMEVTAEFMRQGGSVAGATAGPARIRASQAGGNQPKRKQDQNANA